MTLSVYSTTSNNWSNARVNLSMMTFVVTYNMYLEGEDCCKSKHSAILCTGTFSVDIHVMRVCMYLDKLLYSVHYKWGMK